MQPPEKSHPYLSMQPASEILRSEDWDSVKPLLFENLVEGLTPPTPTLPFTPSRKGGGVQTMKFVWT